MLRFMAKDDTLTVGRIDGEPVLRRFQRPRLVAMILVLALAASAGSFVLGRLTSQPDREAILAAQNDIAVFAEVELRVVDDAVPFAGVIEDGSRLSLSPPQNGPSVVVRAPLRVGDSVEPGTFLGLVSGAPTFALRGPLPLYRSLARGDSGEDVLALQAALAAAGLKVETTGRFDGQTATAISELHKRADVPFNVWAPLPLGMFLPIPSGGGFVDYVAPVGATLSDEQPLVRIVTEAKRVVFRVDVLTSDGITEGQVVEVRAPGDVQFSAAVIAVGSFVEGRDGLISGKDVIAISEDSQLEFLEPSTPVNVTVSTPEEPGLAVPISALRQDDDGIYVLVEDRVAATQLRVDVEVLRSGGGWAAVTEESGEELTPGRRVLVAG